MADDDGGLDYSSISAQMQAAQTKIMTWAESMSGQRPHVDEWTYDKGAGGGRTIVWECTDDAGKFFEKGGVNWSGLEGKDMPASATTALALPAGTGFKATGVSLVMHPHNPMVPTIHMNVRYFEADAAADLWWFGGGIDVTPVYPQFAQVVQFHRALSALCARHGRSYADYKRQCDDYFYLAHRKETRGVGGIFFDNLGPRKEGAGASRQAILRFVLDLANSFPDLYEIFTANRALPYTPAQRDFQLWRRSRYVEFNLLFDRGTKFGIQSEGRTESILMSLPAVCTWRYAYQPEPDTPEAKLLSYLKPQRWLDLQSEDELE